MNAFVKNTATRIAAASGCFALGRTLTRSSLRIFTFHGVERCDDPILNFDRLQIDPELFERQAEWIASRYRVISGSEFLAAVDAGGRWPNRAALITFDDGYANNLEIAAPILKRLGVPAVVFVTTGFLDGTETPWWYALRAQMVGDETGEHEVRKQLSAVMRLEKELIGKKREEQESFLKPETRNLKPFRFLPPDQLLRLKDFGIEIGLHGHRHLACGVEERGVILDDMRISRQKLQDWGINPLPIFAYPYGSLPSDPRSLSSDLETLGIRAAMTTRMGINPAGFDPYLLRRYDVNGGRTEVNLAAISSGLW